MKVRSLKKFFELLPRGGWEITPDGAIRRKRGGCCPVVAVARRLGFPMRGLELSATKAAKLIGMPSSMEAEIAGAADWDFYPLRSRLISHCRLEDQ